MKRDILMLTLPNSGSTWFGNVLANHIPGCGYSPEFFNPLRNPKYEAILSRQFGCELLSCYRNIVAEGDAAIDDDIRRSWGAEQFRFTKEVFSPFKLEAFSRHFRCFVFLRPAEQSFPPARLRIWSFYEHAWFALRDSGVPLSAETTRERAREAHEVLTARILEDAERLRIPIIAFDDLFSGEERLAQLMERALGFACPGLAEEIASTRKPSLRQAETTAAS
jgi:hypothetical protein